MSYGFFALLDDVAALAKTAAATLDDIATTTARTTANSASLVIDDTAVAPKYVIGFSANRELPIIGKITLGSLRNKFLFLLPLAIFLGYVAPFLIMPLLMIGGLYLSFEGAEKVSEMIAVLMKRCDHHETVAMSEMETVRGAIRTDFILSAEIMAMALATVMDKPIMTQTIVLLFTGLFITIIVYGAVALIVRADDVGLRLVQTSDYAALRLLGKGLVLGMPYFLAILGGIGSFAMLWVGGGILLHHFHLVEGWFVEMVLDIVFAFLLGVFLHRAKNIAVSFIEGKK